MSFNLVFVGRSDCCALLRPNGDYTRVNKPPRGSLLRDHFAGSLTLAMYMVNEKGECCVAVFRPMVREGVDELVGLQHRLASLGLPSYLEATPRGGLRLWLFIEIWCDVRLLWGALLPYCPPNVKLYPREDTPSWEHPGAMVRLPLGVYSNGQRYSFIEMVDASRYRPYFTTLEEGLQWLETVEHVTLDALTHLARANEQPPLKTLQKLFDPLLGAKGHPSAIHQKEKEQKDIHQLIHQPSIESPSVSSIVYPSTPCREAT